MNIAMRTRKTTQYKHFIIHFPAADDISLAVYTCIRHTDRRPFYIGSTVCRQWSYMCGLQTNILQFHSISAVVVYTVDPICTAVLLILTSPKCDKLRHYFIIMSTAHIPQSTSPNSANAVLTLVYVLVLAAISVYLELTCVSVIRLSP